jgi:hypothetical protein
MAPRFPDAPMAHLALSATLLAGLGACQPKIGDPCERAIDCGINVIRQCDLSFAPQDPEEMGECTIEDCVFGVCPEDEDSICVKVYGSQFLSVPCDPDREDRGDDCVAAANAEPDACTDDCDTNEVCLPEGLCADEITARTSCRLMCENDDDCRPAYRCKRTGVDGLYVAPDPSDPTSQPVAKICVPDA